MEKQTNIKSFDSSNFLNWGAFIRWNGKWHIYQLAQNFPGPSGISQKNTDISISYRNFYDQASILYSVENTFIWETQEWKLQWKSESNSAFGAWQGPNRELYTQAFQSVQSRILQGDWQKAVPMAIDRLPTSLTRPQLKALLSNLSEAPDNLMPFGFWTPQGGVVGATPELIFYRRGSDVQSMALAGTQEKKGPSTLLQDPKNLKEHQFVVQEIQKKWSQWGTVETGATEVLELPTLYHLLTRFQTRLKPGITDEQLVDAFHPTSALGVFPHEKWREMYDLPLQKERGNFGAPLVFPLPGEEESLAIVSLRQIQWDLHEIKLCAGGGVVKESQEELEWREILAKMNAVRKLLKV